MSVITENSIQECFQDILNELILLVRPDSWVIFPQGCRLTTVKTKYGMADHKGYIHINHLFIGTDYWQLLQAVMRHEFAHLCIGLQQGHNRTFKACEQLFGACFRGKSKQQATHFNQLVNYRYQLLAVLSNGEEIELKLVHRKNRKYSHYHKQFRLKYFYKQQEIKCFKYRRLE